MRLVQHLFSVRNKTLFCTYCFCLSYYIVSAQSSPLADGIVYELQCSESGVYKLDYTWLSEQNNVLVGSLNPANIQIWTGLGELTETPIQIIGEEDGSLDPGDYILFYGEGGHSTIKGYTQNPFDNNNYYYLKIGTNPGKRIKPQTGQNIPTNISNSYIQTKYINDDYQNLLEESINNSGSGQRWAGQEISNNGITDITKRIDIQNAVDGTLQVKIDVWVRSDQTEDVVLHVGDQRFSKSVRSVELGDPEDIYARIVSFNETIDFTSAQMEAAEFKIEYDKKSQNAKAWLDEISISYPAINLINNSTQIINKWTDQTDGLLFTDLNNITIWAYEDIGIIESIDPFVTNGGQIVAIKPEQSIILFDAASSLLEPTNSQLIEAQNLYGISAADLVIIYHPDFQIQAEILAQHRRDYSKLMVHAVSVSDIYREFSSGQHSPHGIRYFAKHLWERHDEFRYLLLFGDGSYDYKGLSTDHAFESLVPTYETEESLEPILSFPTDDFFALLDETNPANLNGDLDIAVGRLTPRTPEEAEAIVTKIINYDTNEQTNGDWKSRIAFLADDEDNNLHLNDADRIATATHSKYPLFNQEKIYWDAFVQESTAGGNRYPAANSKLNEVIDQGLLVMNYLGHGGPIGWSQERVLNITDIESWSNYNRLPLIITATCSFTGFDDPNITSAGEAAMLNPVGGAVALFTTVRSVYASKNFRLTQAVFDTIFSKEGGQYIPIGEILRRAKNTNVSDNTNARKFLLIGDPSMRLKVPTQSIVTQMLNDQATTTGKLDTVGALSAIKLSGYIESIVGEIDKDYDGVIDITVFDKESAVRTLQNDPSSYVRTFNVQNNIIFKGKAQVKEGLFEANFTIPVDINYSPGKAKISYYAVDDNGLEAIGAYDQLIIAGTDDQAVIDDKGPEIDLYINSRSFMNGDQIRPNALLIADINDDIGINLSSSSIGHEITAVIDGNTQNTIILNEYFESGLDQFSGGTVLYDLQNLAEGPHTIKVKAYDVANNIGEATLDFIVIDDQDELIYDIMNFPNPIGNDLSIFEFNHGLESSLLDVEISIYDLRGRLIKTKKAKVVSENGRVEDIKWDGITTNNGVLTNGVYLYALKISSAELNNPLYSEFKKLMILK